MITQEELSQFQQKSRNNLRYEKSGEDKILVYNNLKDKIAELGLHLAPDGIYNDAWFGFVTSDEYKEIMEGPYLFYFVKAKCTKKICNTIGLQGGMDPDTSEWFGNSMLPKMLGAGLKYNALIIPEDIFAQQSMEDFEKNLGNNLGRLFPTQHDALSWLRSVN